MKLTKKLFPAIGMLLLSACMLVTSTFAWFAMNENVTATGMSVTAKGDQVYLQIVAGKSTPQDGETPAVNVWENMDGKHTPPVSATTLQSSEVLPVNVVQSINSQNKKEVVDFGTDGDYATMVWVTNVGTDNANGAASTEYTNVSSADNGKYYIHNTFSIRLDPTAGADVAKKALTIQSIETSATADAFQGCLNVLVVSTINGVKYAQIWDYNESTDEFSKAKGSAALSADPFSDDYDAVIDVYVFFNGDDADCTQVKLAAAAAATYGVEINFTVA